MAVVQNPIVGRAKNKFGNAIFSTWKGKNVLRTKPLEVSNPRSFGQTLQRNRLSKAVELYRMAKGGVDIGFKSQAVGRTEYNAFVAHNMQYITQVGNTTDVEVDFEQLIFSKGSLPFTAIGTDTIDTTSIDLLWSDDSSGGSSGISSNDKLLVVAVLVKTATGEVIESLVSFDAAIRGDEAVSIPWSNTLGVGNTMYVYPSFISEDGRNAQDSILLTQVGS